MAVTNDTLTKGETDKEHTPPVHMEGAVSTAALVATGNRHSAWILQDSGASSSI